MPVYASASGGSGSTTGCSAGRGVTTRLPGAPRLPGGYVDELTIVIDLERPVGIYLYGRRMYEVMVGWETDPTFAEQSPVMRDFAELWQAAEKIVYSKTLEKSLTARTRIERDFAPAAVQEFKASAGRDLTVGGPELAAHAFRGGLVDECHLFVSPIVVGGGKRALPDNVRLPLELQDIRRFRNGMVYLRYCIQP